MITVLHYIISIYYTIHAHTYVYRYHNTTLLHYTTSSVLHHSITSHSICIIYITTQRVLPAHNIYPLLHYLTVYIKPYNDTLPITIFASTRYSISYISHHYLSIYLFISNTRYSHSSIPRCNNLSFINYTFIYAHKNSETKNQSAFATFHWSQKIIWIEICWQVMGARSPSKSGILSRVSSRGEEPDEYPDKQPVAWPARSISVQAQHPQPFFPSSQSASRFIPLWGNSSFFSSPLPSFVVERGFWIPRGRYLARPRWINLGDTKEEDLKRRRKSKLWDCLLYWMGERMVF